MVDIFIGAAIPPVQNNLNRRDQKQPQAPLKKKIKDRRRNKQDRRSENRDGVIVTLSQYPERRRRVDRRKSDS